MLEIVTEYKYLGILLDSKLNFENHIKMLKQRIFIHLITLKKIRWTISEKEAFLLYKACIMPFLDQGDVFYSCARKDVLKSFQTIQNRALRIIIGKKNWVNTITAHSRLLFLTTSNRRNLNILCYAHKLSLKSENLKSHSMRSLRSNRKLLLVEPRSHCRSYDKSFVLNCRKLWNSLPEDVKKIRNTMGKGLHCTYRRHNLHACIGYHEGNLVPISSVSSNQYPGYICNILIACNMQKGGSDFHCYMKRNGGAIVTPRKCNGIARIYWKVITRSY